MISNLQPNGPFTFLVGAADIEENVLVQFGTDALIVCCGTSGTPVGFTQNAHASGATASVYQCIGEAVLKAGEPIAVGDYLRSDGRGRLVVGATGAAVYEARLADASLDDHWTVAVAKSAANGDGDFIKVFFVHSA